MTFANPPVADPGASTAFDEAIGCAKNGKFSNERAAIPARHGAATSII